MMNSRSTALCACLLVVGSIAGAQDPSNPASALAQSRRQTLQRLSVSTEPIRDPAVVDLMAAGLSDDDRAVRRAAAALLSTLITQGNQDRHAKRVSVLETRGDTVRRVLIQALAGDDYILRGLSVKGLIFLGPWNRALETRFLDAYQHETDLGVRALLMFELARAAQPSERTEAAFAAAMNDNSIRIRKQAVIGLGRMQSSTALARLIAELRSGSDDTRDEVVYALGQYGAEAQPYLKELERWRGIAAARGNTAEAVHIERTMRAIEESR
jgi:HEAT repeat protein